jgi:hypothetical protein
MGKPLNISMTSPFSVNTVTGTLLLASSIKIEGNDGHNAVAIGYQAGYTGQGNSSVTIGYQAGAGPGSTGPNDGSVAIGFQAGYTGQGLSSVAIGIQAGSAGQGDGSVSIGSNAGELNQNPLCIAMGREAGQNNQHDGSIAIGSKAGRTGQGDLIGYAVAIGVSAGEYNQSNDAVAIGYYAGYTGQGESAIAIGFQAGCTGQGSSSIAIGSLAGDNNQIANSIVLNATGSSLSAPTPSLYVAPISSSGTIVLAPPTPTNFLLYDTTTHEITYGDGSGIGGGGAANTATYQFLVSDSTGVGNLNNGVANPASVIYDISSPLTTIANPDSTITFTVNGSPQLYIEYTGPGRIQITLNSEGVIEYQSLIGPVSSPLLAIFTDSPTNDYYQSGIQLLCLKNPNLALPATALTATIGQSAMMNQGAVYDSSAYMGGFSGSTSMTTGDKLYFTQITNGYFNSSGGTPATPAWLSGFTAQPINHYYFQLVTATINMNCVRMSS